MRENRPFGVNEGARYNCCGFTTSIKKAGADLIAGAGNSFGMSRREMGETLKGLMIHGKRERGKIGGWVLAFYSCLIFTISRSSNCFRTKKQLQCWGKSILLQYYYIKIRSPCSDLGYVCVNLGAILKSKFL